MERSYRAKSRLTLVSIAGGLSDPAPHALKIVAVFLAEALGKARMDAGLPSELAMKLARETISGSGELLRRSPLEPAKLRENVTSPGGTTAAALEILMGKDGFETLLQRAIAAAARRSRELAG